VHSSPYRLKMSTQYFSCSGGPDAVSIKSTPGHVTLNFVFLHPMGTVDHVLHSGASRP
jgi:hypothetical protein